MCASIAFRRATVRQPFARHSKEQAKPDTLPIFDEGMKLHPAEDSNAANDVARHEYVSQAIANVLGIPQQQAVGGGDKNIWASSSQLYTTCLVPLACLIEDAMNLQLVPRLLGTAQTSYGRIRVSFKFGDHLRGSYHERAQQDSEALAGNAWATANEIRATRGLGPIPGGDVLPVKASTPAAGGAAA
jgi:hypothetical protein